MTCASVPVFETEGRGVKSKRNTTTTTTATASSSSLVGSAERQYREEECESSGSRADQDTLSSSSTHHQQGGTMGERCFCCHKTFEGVKLGESVASWKDRRRRCYLCIFFFCSSCVQTRRVVASVGCVDAVPVCTLCVLQKPKCLWSTDSEHTNCEVCETTKFGFFSRRHHCRQCGAVVCASCSSEKQNVPVVYPKQDSVNVRVCSRCKAQGPLPTAAIAPVMSMGGGHHDAASISTMATTTTATTTAVVGGSSGPIVILSDHRGAAPNPTPSLPGSPRNAFKITTTDLFSHSVLPLPQEIAATLSSSSPPTGSPRGSQGNDSRNPAVAALTSDSSSFSGGSIITPHQAELSFLLPDTTSMQRVWSIKPTATTASVSPRGRGSSSSSPAGIEAEGTEEDSPRPSRLGTMSGDVVATTATPRRRRSGGLTETLEFVQGARGAGSPGRVGEGGQQGGESGSLQCTMYRSILSRPQHAPTSTNTILKEELGDSGKEDVKILEAGAFVSGNEAET